MYTNVKLNTFKQIFKDPNAKSAMDMECGERYIFVLTEPKYIDIAKWTEYEQIKFRTTLGVYNDLVEKLCEYTDRNHVCVLNPTVLKFKFEIKSYLKTLKSMENKFNKKHEEIVK